MIRFVCWNCGKSLKSSPTNAGKKCRCGGCNELNTIPSFGVETPSTAPTDNIEIDFQADSNSVTPAKDPFDFTPQTAEPSPVLPKQTPKVAGPGMVFCYKCASIIFEEAEICPNCGCRQKRKNAENYREIAGPTGLGSSEKPSRVVAFLLAFFLGLIGAHKFYLGQTSMGLLYLVVFCFSFLLFFVPLFFLAVICLIESIMYLSMSDEEFVSKYGR